MKNSNSHDERIAKMTFASVYPHYVTKIEKKNRTKEELHQVIEWLTSFNEETLKELINNKVTFEEFFRRANINQNAHLITGVICGYRVEDIKDHLTNKYLKKKPELTGFNNSNLFFIWYGFQHLLNKSPKLLY